MNKAIYSKRVDSLREDLAGMPCDMAWVIQPENRRYLSGFLANDPQFTESSGSLLINENQCILVTDSRYVSEAEKEAVAYEVQSYKKSFIEEFPEVVCRIGTKNLGFEEGYVTWGLHKQLSENFDALSPSIPLTPLDCQVEKIREVKDDQEIAALEASANMISEILDEVISGLNPGLTEKDVAWKIETLAHEAGAEDLAFPSIVASGPNSALPHATPTNRKLRNGDPIVLDAGVKFEGYCSDMTRTVFLGKPTSDLRKIYMTVLRAQLAALKEIRAGVDSNHPDAVARNLISDAGFGEYFGHSLGHGVGLATHEMPKLGPLKPTKLLKNMVVTVEPGIYIPGKGGVRLEEMVLIEEDGVKVLTKNNSFYDFNG